MKTFLSIIVLIPLCVTASYAVDNSIVLTMKERVVVENSHVKISDVVLRFKGGRELVKKIENKVILNLGNTVNYRKVNKEVIAEVIKRNVQGVKIIFGGSLNTIVKVKTQLFTYDDVVDDIVKDISEKVSLVSNKYSINYIGNIREHTSPAGTVSFSYKLPNKLLKKRISVWTDVYVDSQHYRSLPLWFDISVIAEVPVVSKKLRPGEKISALDFVMKKRDITLFKEPITNINTIDNLRLKKIMNIGDVLTHSLLEEMPPIYKGQTVEVMSLSGNVSIYLKGLSLDDGVIGQLVRVQRVGTNRVFNAIVKEQGLVSAVGS